MNDKAVLNKEMKLLLLKIFASGEVTAEQAKQFDKFFKETKLLENVIITFE